MAGTLYSFPIDMLLVGAGLVALACVMAFLIVRPGRKRRAEIAVLLRRPLDSSSDGVKPRAESQTDSSLPIHSIFISYRRTDSRDIVERLYDHLKSELGRNAVFKDVDSIRAGGDFRTQIEASLEACRVFLCVMGDQWAGPTGSERRLIDNPNDFVRIEVETALRRDIAIIPVFVRGLHMPPPDFFPESLRNLAFRQGLPLRPDPDFHGDVARLLSNLAVHLEMPPREESRAN
jgi:TIR domain